MASQPGPQPRRWRASRHRNTNTAAPAPEVPPPSPDEESAPAPAPEAADIYRTLFTELRRAFGGTVDDANADAIAFAASELYRKDVEPRLWEHKTAHEILDGFGVPRAGAFTRYSLSDRLLLLRRSSDPGRADHAHALLTELGAPESDETGSRLSLKDRLAWVLEGSATTPAGSGAGGPDGAPAAVPPNGSDAAVGTDEAPPDPGELAEALEAMGETAASAGGDGAPAAEPLSELPAAELVGLGTVIAGIQEELIRLRQAVETVESRLDEVLTLLRSGAAGAVPPNVETATSPAESSDTPPVAPVVEAGPEPSTTGDAENALEPAAPVAAAPDDVTRVVPAVPEGIPLDEVPPAVPARRRRTLPKLILIAVVLGLLIAGVAIAISVVGWSEMRSRLRIGSATFAASTLIATVASARGDPGMLVDLGSPRGVWGTGNPNGGMWWPRSRR